MGITGSRVVEPHFRVVVLGGGLAGMRAAWAASEGLPTGSVCLCERGSRLLAGWRAREFGPAPAEAPLVAMEEPPDPAWVDGLELPGVVDLAPLEAGLSISTLATDLATALAARGVRLRLGAKAMDLVHTSDGTWRVWMEEGASLVGDQIIIATGGGRNRAFRWAEDWALRLSPRLPAGLNLRLSQSRGQTWNQMPELPASVSDGAATGQAAGGLGGAHPWLSGSALAELTLLSPAGWARARYRGELVVNWMPPGRDRLSARALALHAEGKGGRLLGELPWPGLHPSLWGVLLRRARIDGSTPWRALSPRQAQTLAGQIERFRLRYDGFRLDREAGISAGGVVLGDLVPGTFESRARAGVFWVGESVDLHATTTAGNVWLALASGEAAGAAVSRGAV